MSHEIDQVLINDLVYSIAFLIIVLPASAMSWYPIAGIISMARDPAATVTIVIWSVVGSVIWSMMIAITIIMMTITAAIPPGRCAARAG